MPTARGQVGTSPGKHCGQAGTGTRVPPDAGRLTLIKGPSHAFSYIEQRMGGRAAESMRQVVPVSEVADDRMPITQRPVAGASIATTLRARRPRPVP